MSGGHFDYAQYKIDEISLSIEHEIEKNENEFSDDIISRFREAILALRQAKIYAHRIDWLLSGDDGPESFLERLNEELKPLNP